MDATIDNRKKDPATVNERLDETALSREILVAGASDEILESTWRRLPASIKRQYLDDFENYGAHWRSVVTGAARID